MKKIVFSLIFLSLSAHADRSCMDNSQHGDTSWGYDYKKYDYVDDCTCPCWRYGHSSNRNQCERCGHFNVPRTTAKKDQE